MKLDLFSRRFLLRSLLFIMIIVVNIGCDQQTKQMAKASFEDRNVEYSYFNDVFKLTYAENYGAFLSLGDDLPQMAHFLLLKLMPLLLLIGMFCYVLFSQTLSMAQAIAMSFIVGGGLSNVMDRIYNEGGGVVDFMKLGIGDLQTGIFNFADVSVMIGIFALLFLNFRR
ncbi:MAG: signal peptidase II [Bacteroidota bacterium]